MVAWQEMGAWEPPLVPSGGRWAPLGQVGRQPEAWLAVQVGAWAWDRQLELAELAASNSAEVFGNHETKSRIMN